MRIRAFVAALAVLMILPISGSAADQPALTPDQKNAVEKLIQEYLLEHPEIIVKAIEKLREKQRLAEAERARKALAERHDELFNDKNSPQTGNLKGDVTVVEFFDYRCGYCKGVFESVLKAVKDDGKVRLVLKEFPILGPESRFASQAALASRKQGKYMKFHTALMRARGGLSKEATITIARSVGLDVKRLRDDMNDPAISALIERNFKLAAALNIRGTPAFIVGDRLVPGAVNLETLKSMIAEARSKNKS